VKQHPIVLLMIASSQQEAPCNDFNCVGIGVERNYHQPNLLKKKKHSLSEEEGPNERPINPSK
jgi:hypothetical protein